MSNCIKIFLSNVCSWDLINNLKISSTEKKSYGVNFQYAIQIEINTKL